MRLSFLLLAPLALTVVACGGSTEGNQPKSADSKAHPLVGKPAPAFEGSTVAGSGTASTDQKGTVLVVDFWATYCGPCVKEFPKLQALQDRYAGKIQVIGVSEDEEKDAVAPFVQRTGVKFPITWDKDKAIGAKYNVDSMPQTFVLDKSGVVRFVHHGYHSGESSSLEDEVKQLLAE